MPPTCVSRPNNTAASLDGRSCAEPRALVSNCVTLADGSVLMMSGSYLPNRAHDRDSQIWRDEAPGTPVARLPDDRPFEPLYQRLHLASNGSVFMAGPLVQTWSLSVGGQWSPVAPRINGRRDYAASVMYAEDKVIYIAVATMQKIAPRRRRPRSSTWPPTTRHWEPTSPMHVPRRQHNATILPDGTVLVTGGTRGGGEPSNGFNDLSAGQPVHTAELWDPVTGTWRELAAERVDRCYHATAILLPDGRVLSAGGGEYRRVQGDPAENDPRDSHRNAQVFSPPYLFRGDRPEISSAPEAVTYESTFRVRTPRAAEIAKVSLIGLSSVTHAFNAGQHIAVVSFAVAAADALQVAPPGSLAVAPPGPHTLFLINSDGVPSKAHILRLEPSAAIPLRPP